MSNETPDAVNKITSVFVPSDASAAMKIVLESALTINERMGVDADIAGIIVFNSLGIAAKGVLENKNVPGYNQKAREVVAYALEDLGTLTMMLAITYSDPTIIDMSLEDMSARLLKSVEKCKNYQEITFSNTGVQIEKIVTSCQKLVNPDGEVNIDEAFNISEWGMSLFTKSIMSDPLMDGMSSFTLLLLALNGLVSTISYDIRLGLPPLEAKTFSDGLASFFTPEAPLLLKHEFVPSWKID